MVRLSSMDGDPVYRVDEVRHMGSSDRSRRSRRNRWPVFGARRARSERGYGEDDRYTYASRRTATDLLYGAGGSTGSHRSYGGGGHIHTRYNPTSRVFVEESDERRSYRSRRSRSWSRSQPSMANTLINSISRRRRGNDSYLDQPEGSQEYLDDPQKYRSEADYSSSTYPRFVVPGWAHIVIGLLLIGIGVTDIAWTAAKYEGNCDFKKDNTFDGCATENIYTYIASPLWGGVIMIFTGLIPFVMTPYRLLYSNWLPYVFLVGCFFCFLAIAPAIIALYILLITENKDKFWANDDDDGIVLQDEAKFALAVVVIILAFLDWMVSLLGILLGVFCPPQTESNFGKNPYASRGYRSYVDAAPIIVEDERPTRSGRRSNYPRSVPEIITTEVVKPRTSRAHSDVTYGAPPLRPGERVVYEERIRPGASRASGSRYSDDESLYSRDRRSRASYARSDDYHRGGGRRDYARSDYSRGSRMYDFY